MNHYRDKIVLKKREVDSQFKQLSSIDEDNKEHVQLYAKMLINLGIEPSEGKELLKRLSRIDLSLTTEFDRDSHEKKLLTNGKTTVYLTVSGNKDNLGIILSATHQLHSVLGYSPKSVKGMNINAIMPEYIKVRHDQILRDYFKKSAKSQGVSRDILVTPLHANGHLVISLAKVKILPDLDQGLVIFCIVSAIELEELLEDDELGDEGVDFIAFVRETGEIMGISEGADQKYGIKSILFTNENLERNLKITDFFENINQNAFLTVARQRFTKATLDTSNLLELNLVR